MMQDFSKLIGKNVLIFDLETTGFGIGKDRWYDPKDYETSFVEIWEVFYSYNTLKKLIFILGS